MSQEERAPVDSALHDPWAIMIESVLPGLPPYECALYALLVHLADAYNEPAEVVIGATQGGLVAGEVSHGVWPPW